MNWQMVILLNILIYTIAVALIKLASNKLPRTQGLCWQYLFCAIYVWGYRLLINQNITFSSADLIVLAIGFFNCFGAYLQWRAIKIHLSKTALYDPLSEVITISLATIFLSEFKAWNFPLVLGMALSFSSFYLFYLKRVSELKEWTVCTIGMFVIFGVVTFLMKVFAIVPVSIGLFLFKERKGLSRIETLAFLIGIAGALLIILS